jgi:hypothetical protein
MSSTDHDLELKLRLRRILFTQGYWSPIEVELSHYEDLGTGLRRRPLTDLDVLGIKYDHLFVPHRVVGDCKSGKGVSDIGRIFWLRGLMHYFGADLGYYLRPKIDAHARAVAPTVALRALNQYELVALEKAISVDSFPIPLADQKLYVAIENLWGVHIPKGQKPTPDQLALKKVYSYLSYKYWSSEFYRNLLTLVAHFQEIAHLLSPTNPQHVLLAYIGAERFGHCLLDVASHVQALGALDIPRYCREYLFGGPTHLKEKERFFVLLKKVTGTEETLDPPGLPDVLELVGRLIRNPLGASDILRHLTAAYVWCAHLGNNSLPKLNPTSVNTAAIVLAKDTAFTFCKVTGISKGLFSATEPL